MSAIRCFRHHPIHHHQHRQMDRFAKTHLVAEEREYEAASGGAAAGELGIYPDIAHGLLVPQDCGTGRPCATSFAVVLPGAPAIPRDGPDSGDSDGPFFDEIRESQQTVSMTSTDSVNWGRSVATTYTTSQTPPAQSSTKNNFCGHRFFSLRNAKIPTRPPRTRPPRPDSDRRTACA